MSPLLLVIADSKMAPADILDYHLDCENTGKQTHLKPS